MKVLVTGAAGFIGFHLTQYLLNRGDEVVGLDNINEYYDVRLKYGRLRETGIDEQKISYGITVNSERYPKYQFIKLDITDHCRLKKVFKNCHFDAVCNLAAQAGVRYSITNPKAYIESNIMGFMNVLECCRVNNIKHLVYASSSSVYGLNKKMPFSVSHGVDHPVSLYAASKKSNELMAHTYSHLFQIPTTGLRFFTVYGPWGRPDMSLYLFTKAIMENRPIDIYNNGEMKRDFTYIDDIVDGIAKVIDRPAKANRFWNDLRPDPSTSNVPYRIFNIGRGESVNLMDFITELERLTKRIAIKNYMPLQDGDVLETWADIRNTRRMTGYEPKTSFSEGIERFVDWYTNFYPTETVTEKILQAV
jgi:UDP-glucuronate 4-epimerase